MQKNLTLTIDEVVLKTARKAALNQDTSVNQLVRDFLAQLGREQNHQEDARLQLAQLFKRSRYQMGKRNWTREDLYDRG